MARVKRKPAAPKPKRDAYGLIDADEEPQTGQADPAGGTDLFATPAPRPAPDEMDGAISSLFDKIGLGPKAAARDDARVAAIPWRERLDAQSALLADPSAGEVAGAALQLVPAAGGVVGKMLGSRGVRAALDKSNLMHELGLVADEIDFSKLKGAIPGKGTVPRALSTRFAELTAKLTAMAPGTSRGTAPLTRSANVLEGLPGDLRVKDLNELVLDSAIGVLSPRAKHAYTLGKGAYDIIKRKMKGGP